jgi:hypothetical protein
MFVGFNRRGQVLRKKQDRLVVAVLLWLREQMRLLDCEERSVCCAHKW